ncbi:MAG: glycosyltransferase [Spirochaetes bacterium]|nr:glycosyltransferase [Spirochaetota bacterium]
MKIILIAIGSHGDVNPFIGIGMALQQRGHSITMLANPHFEKNIRGSGFEFIPVGTLDEYYRTIDRLSGPEMKSVINDYLYIRPMRPVYDYLASHYIEHETIVVSNIYCTGARLANEKLGIPIISVNLVPMMFVSSYDPPIFTFTRYPRWIPRFVFSLMIEVAHFVMDHDLVPAISTFRKEIGLPPRLRRVNRWMLSPDKIIGLFPEWYGRPQPDWPPNIDLVGFPLFDEGHIQNGGLPAELEDFLSAGAPPIIFTPGTPNKNRYASFFEKAIEATKKIGARAIFVSQFKEQIPRDLPSHVRYYPYLPFSLVFPRASAVVFHGGIGTIAQAMRAGIPQLIAPWGVDQFDNGARIKSLGLGDMISSLRCTVDSLAEKLQYVVTSPKIQKRCAEASAKIIEADPINKACSIIEGFGAA